VAVLHCHFLEGGVKPNRVCTTVQKVSWDQNAVHAKLYATLQSLSHTNFCHHSEQWRRWCL